jgi:hypothetical protein
MRPQWTNHTVVGEDDIMAMENGLMMIAVAKSPSPTLWPRIKDGKDCALPLLKRLRLEA